MIITM